MTTFISEGFVINEPLWFPPTPMSADQIVAEALRVALESSRPQEGKDMLRIAIAGEETLMVLLDDEETPLAEQQADEKDFKRQTDAVFSNTQASVEGADRPGS